MSNNHEDDTDRKLPPAEPSIHDKDARTLPVSGARQLGRGGDDLQAGRWQNKRSVEDTVARKLDALVPPTAPKPDYKKLVGREGLLTLLNSKIKNIQNKLLDQMIGQARQSNVERELTTVSRETAETWAKAFRVMEIEDIPDNTREELQDLINKLRLRWLMLKKTTELVNRGTEIVASTTSLIEDSSSMSEVQLSLPSYLIEELDALHTRALTLVTKLQTDQDRYRTSHLVWETEKNDKVVPELSRAVIQMMLFAAFTYDFKVEAPPALIDNLIKARIIMLFLGIEEQTVREWGDNTQITPLLNQFLEIYTPTVVLTTEPFYSHFWEKVLISLQDTERRVSLYERGQMGAEGLGISMFGLVDFLVAKNMYQHTGQENFPPEAMNIITAVARSRYFNDIIKAVRGHKPKMFQYTEKDRQALITFLTELRNTR